MTPPPPPPPPSSHAVDTLDTQNTPNDLNDSLNSLSITPTTKTTTKKTSKLSKCQQKQLNAYEAAFKFFCEHYAAQYGQDRWYNQLLPALQQPTKYCALLNKFSAEEDLSVKLSKKENEWLLPRLAQIPFLSVPAVYVKDEVKNYDEQQQQQQKLSKKQQAQEEKPFPTPSMDMKNMMDYYCLDAASLMVIEALNVQPDDFIADICAAPGGKSLGILQKLDLTNPNVYARGRLVSNEISDKRRARLKKVFREYIPNSVLFSDGTAGKSLGKETNTNAWSVKVTDHDGTKWHRYERDLYDKVIVDAPCSSDRHLLHASAPLSATSTSALSSALSQLENEQQTLTKWSPARLKIDAKRQQQLLFSALNIVKPDGGIIVYATCSISNIENDDVIEKTLMDISKKNKALKKKLKGKGGDLDYDSDDDLESPLIVEILKKKFSVGEETKYGWIVLPDKAEGWGPIYFCILRRLPK